MHPARNSSSARSVTKLLLLRRRRLRTGSPRHLLCRLYDRILDGCSAAPPLAQAPEMPARYRGGGQQWLPAIPLTGPQPWWAQLRPGPGVAEPFRREERWRQALRKFRLCEGAQSAQLPSVIRQVIEQQGLSGMDEEELPVSVALYPPTVRDAIRLITKLARDPSARSARTETVGCWTAHSFGGRTIVRPTDLDCAIWAQLCSRFPTEWSWLEG